MALNWSFKARLYNASDLMKKRYGALIDELNSYKGVKTRESWGKVRIYIGRKTYGAMIFRGKTLCVALALNPDDYAESKYIFENIGEVASYEGTPMLVRLSSERQLKYFKELLGEMFDGVDVLPVEHTVVDIPFKEKEELIEELLIKVTKGRKKADPDDEEEVPPAPKPKKVKEPEPEPEREPEPTPPPAPEKKPEPKREPAPKPETVVAEPVDYPIPENVPEAPKCAVNLDVICANFAEGSTVTPQALKDKGLIPADKEYVKVLARGGIAKKMTIAACKFSKNALKLIAECGAKAVIIETLS